MTHFKDLDIKTQVAAGPNIRAVGWLGEGHSFATGTISSSHTKLLDAFVASRRRCARALAWGAFGGSHTCEFCNAASGAEYIAIPHKEVLFVSPDLIAHYVARHHYLPPSSFLSALTAAPLPGSFEYNIQVAPFNPRLSGKHPSIQQLIARMGAELGWDHFVYFSPPRSDPNVIILGDYQQHTPQARLIVRTGATPEVFSFQLGTGNFRIQDETVVSELFTNVPTSVLLAKVAETFTPAASV